MRRDNVALLRGIVDKLYTAAVHIEDEGVVPTDELYDAIGELLNYIDAQQKEQRTEYAVQKIDQQVQAKGEAIKARIAAHPMTPDEVEDANTALFGEAR